MKKLIKLIILVALVLGGVVLGIGIANSQRELIEEKFEISENFSDFDINIDTSNIQFVKANDNNTSVVFNKKDGETNKAEVVDNKLVITQKSKSWFSNILSFSFKKSKIFVYLPNESYSDLSLVSSTGDITIPKDFKFKNASITVSTGNVKLSCEVDDLLSITSSTGKKELSDIKCNNLKLKASTGDINIDKANVTNDVTINVSTGDVKLKELKSKNLSIEATTGHITLTSTIVDDSTTIKTSTGKVILDSSDSGSYKITTSTGDVKGTLLSSKIFDAKSDTGIVDTPTSSTGGRCEISSSTGNIKISIKG